MRALPRWFARAVIAGGVLSLCVYLVAAENSPPAAKAPDLAQRVVELEAKVAQLKKKIEQLSSPPLLNSPPAMTPRFLPPRATVAAPVQPGAEAVPAPVAPELPPGVPPNATPREFNGQTYYIVPLAKEATR